MTPESLRLQFAIHRRLRWVGVGLFCLALPVPIAVVTTALLHGGKWAWILPSIGCLGLSLGAFGTANDTAVFALRELNRRGVLPAEGAAELHAEQARRPERLDAVHASPKAAFVFPFVAAALIVWMTMRVWGAWAA